MTSVTPSARRSATLLLTAALRPTPGCHKIVAPRSPAHAATSSSSHATYVGSSPAAASTRADVQRARRSRSASSRTAASRAFPSANALTGTRTTAFTPRIVGTYAVTMAINVAVIGAGSWGTTVAALAAVNAPTILWARRPELAAQINDAHVNGEYLANFMLPEQLQATGSLKDAVSHADVLVMAVPSHGYRDVV